MITQKQVLQYVYFSNRRKTHAIGYSYAIKNHIPYKLQTINILLSDSEKGYSDNVFEVVLRNGINTERNLKRVIDGARDAVLAWAVENFDLPVFILIRIFERVNYDKGGYYWFRKQSDYNDLPLYIINEIEGYFGCT